MSEFLHTSPPWKPWPSFVPALCTFMEEARNALVELDMEVRRSRRLAERSGRVSGRKRYVRLRTI